VEWKIDYNHKLLNFGVLLQAHKNKNKSNLIILKVQIDFFFSSRFSCSGIYFFRSESNFDNNNNKTEIK
jgi:hypothetical protein